MFEVKDKKRFKGIFPKTWEDIGKKVGLEGNHYCEVWDSLIDEKEDPRLPGVKNILDVSEKRTTSS
jgi:hypothetical protein